VLDVLSKLGLKFSNDQLQYRGKTINEYNLIEFLSSKLGLSHPAISEYYAKYNSHEKAKTLLEEFVAKYFKEVQELDFSKIPFREGVPYTYSQIKIFRNESNSRTRKVIYPSGVIDDFDSRELDDKLETDLGEQAKDFLRTNCIRGKIGYFPKNENLVVMVRGINYVNFWKKPEWEKLNTAEVPTDNFVGFMEHFFPDEKDRKYMYAWARDMVDSRAGSAVILTGKPGTGKNTFAEKICQRLVGEENYRKAVSGEGRGGGSRFHNGLDICRLRFYDEIQLNANTRNDIKNFMNEVAAIERKGLDIEAPSRMWASFILANNSPEEVELEHDDRKFFAPNLANVKLEEAFSVSWIEQFERDLAAPEYIRSVYLKCCELGYGVDSKYPHKTAAFIKYCFNSFPFAIRKLVEKLEVKPVIHSREFRTRLDPFEVQKYLEDYRVKFGIHLADFHDLGGGRYQITLPGYDPNKELGDSL